MNTVQNVQSIALGELESSFSSYVHDRLSRARYNISVTLLQRRRQQILPFVFCCLNGITGLMPMWSDRVRKRNASEDESNKSVRTKRIATKGKGGSVSKRIASKRIAESANVSELIGESARTKPIATRGTERTSVSKRIAESANVTELIADKSDNVREVIAESATTKRKARARKRAHESANVTELIIESANNVTEVIAESARAKPIAKRRTKRVIVSKRIVESAETESANVTELIAESANNVTEVIGKSDNVTEVIAESATTKRKTKATKRARVSKQIATNRIAKSANVTELIADSAKSVTEVIAESANVTERIKLIATGEKGAVYRNG